MSASIEEVSGASYDYVVVGGGTTGLTIAARLAEQPDLRVAVLEAGAARLDDPLISQLGRQFGNPDYDWNYQTIPQKHANDRVFTWPSGRILGGNSAINFFVWCKPPKQDIDAWETMGNPGWNWSRFSEALKRVETLAAPQSELATTYRQTYKPEGNNTAGGPLKASFSPVMMDEELVFQDALLASGVGLAKDPFNGDPTGTYMSACSMDPETFTRSYAAKAFFKPNSAKPNFRVLCGASVQRILIDKNHKTDGTVSARGVDFEFDGKVHTVTALKEVILCAGAIKSPQILELSGIGDSKILSPLGIETVIDLPGVGTNLQEHLYGGVVYELNEATGARTMDSLVDQDFAAAELELHGQGKGLFRMCLSGISFLPLNNIMKPDELEEMSSKLKRRSEERSQDASMTPGLKMQWDLRLQKYQDAKSGNCELIFFPLYYGGRPDDDKKKTFVSVLYLLNHPLSRGTIHISTADPKAQPAIDPHYFEEELDLDIMCALVEYVRRLRQYGPLKDTFGKCLREVLPGPNCTSVEDVKSFIKNTVSTTYHATGTCSMLPRSFSGVVDPSLRVYGTANLRVADLSIVPLHVAAHTQTVAYAIAQQAADMLLSNTRV